MKNTYNILSMYSIYDKVSKKFNAPFLAENDEVANRSFQLSCKSNPFSSDFDLYRLGTFDITSDTSAMVIGTFLPIFISHFLGEVVDNG